MLFILIFTLLTICYKCDGLANGTVSSHPHPYFVTLVTPRLCGGVLISLSPEAWVLTAAHCVYSGNGSFVTSGELRYGRKQHQLFHTVITHPKYKRNSYSYNPFRSMEEEEQELTINATIYDVALIKLDHAITTPATSIYDNSYSSIYYNSIGKKHRRHNRPPTIQVIPIAPTNIPSSNAECMGMGATSLSPGSESPKLMTSPCKPTRANRTMGIFASYDNAVQVIEFSSSASLCHGDSGGPLVVNSNQDNYLGGILSRILYAYDPNPDQPACPVPESPDDLPMANVFVKPSFHLPWISQNTQIPIHNLTTPPPSPFVSPSSSYFDILHYSHAPITISPFVGWFGLVSLCSYLLF